VRTATAATSSDEPLSCVVDRPRRAIGLAAEEFHVFRIVADVLGLFIDREPLTAEDLAFKVAKRLRRPTDNRPLSRFDSFCHHPTSNTTFAAFTKSHSAYIWLTSAEEWPNVTWTKEGDILLFSRMSPLCRGDGI
jgi:hypothetical protein